MATVFELTSNFSTKLESDSIKKADGALDCCALALSSGFIKHLMI